VAGGRFVLPAFEPAAEFLDSLDLFHRRLRK
jgi:hypothetical protein